LNYSGDYKDTVIQCTTAIEIDPKAVKAWYLRSVAHMKLQNFDEATSDLKQAITLNPGDKKLRDEFEVLKAEKKKHNSSQADAMKKFFAQGVYQEKEGVKHK
jgi:Tfp pilus assembly protein PilF